MGGLKFRSDLDSSRRQPWMVLVVVELNERRVEAHLSDGRVFLLLVELPIKGRKVIFEAEAEWIRSGTTWVIAFSF